MWIVEPSAIDQNDVPVLGQIWVVLFERSEEHLAAFSRPSLITAQVTIDDLVVVVPI